MQFHEPGYNLFWSKTGSSTVSLRTHIWYAQLTNKSFQLGITCDEPGQTLWLGVSQQRLRVKSDAVLDSQGRGVHDLKIPKEHLAIKERQYDHNDWTRTSIVVAKRIMLGAQVTLKRSNDLDRTSPCNSSRWRWPCFSMTLNIDLSLQTMCHHHSVWPWGRTLTLNVSSLYSPASTAPMSITPSLTDRLTTGLTPWPLSMMCNLDVGQWMHSSSWNWSENTNN